jgi:hypothetical protein
VGSRSGSALGGRAQRPLSILIETGSARACGANTVRPGIVIERFHYSDAAAPGSGMLFRIRRVHPHFSMAQGFLKAPSVREEMTQRLAFAAISCHIGQRVRVRDRPPGRLPPLRFAVLLSAE